MVADFAKIHNYKREITLKKDIGDDKSSKSRRSRGGKSSLSRRSRSRSKSKNDKLFLTQEKFEIGENE